MNGQPRNPYLEAVRAPRTRKEYAYYWRAFEKWCAVRDAVALPALPDTIVGLVIEKADGGERVSSLRSRLAAIRAYHEDEGHDSPTQHYTVKRLIQGIARTQANETPAQVAGLTADGMKAVERVINPRSRTQLMTLALCWTMRDGLLRCAEAAALTWDDIERNQDGSGLIHIRRSKTDQVGVGHIGYLSPKCIRALWRIRPTEATGRVFPMHVSNIRLRIKTAAKRAGLKGRFRGHSPRVGMVQDLAENGYSIVQLQQVGRWRSPNMPAKYARASVARRGAVAQFYGQGHPA